MRANLEPELTKLRKTYFSSISGHSSIQDQSKSFYNLRKLKQDQPEATNDEINIKDENESRPNSKELSARFKIARN